MLSRMVLVFVLAMGAFSAQASDPVKMMTNTWPPYIDEELPQEGMAMELVRHIFLRAGYKVDNTVERWPRALEGVRVGLYDVLGAAGAVEASFSVMTLVDEILPPTINYETPDPECDLDYVPNEARDADGIKYALSNSFGLEECGSGR